MIDLAATAAIFLTHRPQSPLTRRPFAVAWPPPLG
jgi:hypothetical protein